MLGHRLIIAALLLGVAASSAFAQERRASPSSLVGVVRGVVQDSSGRPLADAEVRALPGGPSVRTDAGGRFQLANVAAGEQRLLARHVGFQPDLNDITVEPGATVDVAFLLVSAPIRLDTIRVVERALVPLKYHYTTRFDAFFQHRATSVSGTFFDHDDLERLGGPARALTRLPGVKASENSGVLLVRFARCEGGTSPTVLVNGIVSQASVLNTIPVTSIELIEVYRGVSEVPAEARGNGCGAIAIYTR